MLQGTGNCSFTLCTVWYLGNVNVDATWLPFCIFAIKHVHSSEVALKRLFIVTVSVALKHQPEGNSLVRMVLAVQYMAYGPACCNSFGGSISNTLKDNCGSMIIKSLLSVVTGNFAEEITLLAQKCSLTS